MNLPPGRPTVKTLGGLLRPTGPIRLSLLFRFYNVRTIGFRTCWTTRTAVYGTVGRATGRPKRENWGEQPKKMEHSFGGFPPFSGKDPLKVFSWLRKLVKACDDNDVSERMALYAVPYFLSCDAELRYVRTLPDSGTAVGVASITSYPVAMTLFLQTYAEPHILALAQDTFSRAIIEPEETIESFSARLRGLSDRCGSIHTEGTMKQELIHGLPAYIRTDAFVYNTPACSFQQLVTYTSGKHKAAQGVMTLSLDGQSPSPPSSSRGPRRLSVTPRAGPTRGRFSGDGPW